MNATTQEKQSQNWDLATLAAHNGISPSQMRGTDLLIRQIEHIRQVEKGNIDLTPVELAHRLGLDIHVALKGRHETQYYCPKTMKEIKPLITAFGMLNKRIFCPRCMKSVPYVTGDELGQIVKGSEE